MYNRYIPQPDGSYRKNRMPEPPGPRPQAPPQPPEKPCPPPQPPKRPRPECPGGKPGRPHPDGPLDGFLQKLLPKDFDTGDLIVVLLLLLMAGDCEDSRNNALLTLALYFMM